MFITRRLPRFLMLAAPSSPIFADTFNGDYLTLKFVRDASGQVTGISVATPYTQNHPFKRIDPRALAN